MTHRTAPSFTYFVTTKTWQNRPIFQVVENAEILIDSLLGYRNKDKYLLHEFVVMPDHLHVLLTPASDTSLEKAMMLIKGGSSHEIHKRREVRLEIWQAGFHEESIRDAKDYAGKTEYIHLNPVRARLVERPEEWPYGSAYGKFQMDAAPERLKILDSGAKAPFSAEGYMSDLKVRPPKNLAPSPSGEHLLKTRPPKNLSRFQGGESVLEPRPPDYAADPQVPPTKNTP